MAKSTDGMRVLIDDFQELVVIDHTLSPIKKATLLKFFRLTSSILEEIDAKDNKIKQLKKMNRELKTIIHCLGNEL